MEFWIGWLAPVVVVGVISIAGESIIGLFLTVLRGLVK
jgi:hypothetical protein